MQKQHGSASSDTKLTERRNVEGEYKHSIQKVHNKEYLIKNACYSVTKYYLCKQNNKRSLLGRKQRSQVVRSFPNRYQFSCTNKVTSLFSDRYIFIIILWEQTLSNCAKRSQMKTCKPLFSKTRTAHCGRPLSSRRAYRRETRAFAPIAEQN